MSDEVKDFQKMIAKDEEEAKKRRELQSKELILRERKADLELSRIAESDMALERAKTANFGGLTEQQIREIDQEDLAYCKAAKNGMVFINEGFNGIVPYFIGNLIFIGAKTGEGKSTAVANVASTTIQQKNPETGNPRRVLVITNEERTSDVYNRVTCLHKGWAYVNHDKFTQDQIETFSKYRALWAKNGRLMVVDNNYNGSLGITTTVEGIVEIFENMIANKVYYDAVIIDYYQNVKSSQKNPSLDEYKVQAMLAAKLDQFKNNYPAPIVVMGQAKPQDKDKKPFQERIVGRKVILDYSTIALEMIADRENLRTEWIVHKSRFTEACGNSFFTGYDRGLFVKYDERFMDMVKNRNPNPMSVNIINADFPKKAGGG